VGVGGHCCIIKTDAPDSYYTVSQSGPAVVHLTAPMSHQIQRACRQHQTVANVLPIHSERSTVSFNICSLQVATNLIISSELSSSLQLYCLLPSKDSTWYHLRNQRRTKQIVQQVPFILNNHDTPGALLQPLS
jgi:hypothetical protein